jgi:hypothetical protein
MFVLTYIQTLTEIFALPGPELGDLWIRITQLVLLGPHQILGLLVSTTEQINFL